MLSWSIISDFWAEKDFRFFVELEVFWASEKGVDVDG
jgi:hypothetical protein